MTESPFPFEARSALNSSLDQSCRLQSQEVYQNSQVWFPSNVNIVECSEENLNDKEDVFSTHPESREQLFERAINLL